MTLCSLHQAIAQFTASIHTARFEQDGSHYLELYLGVPAKDVHFKKNDKGLFQGEVETILLIEKEGELISGDKYLLSSPEDLEMSDFWDIKRIPLDPGLYDLSIEMTDVIDSSNTFGFKKQIKIDSLINNVRLSDLVFCSTLSATEGLAFAKYNFQYEMLPYDIVSNKQKSLWLFSEIYGLEHISLKDYAIHYKVYDAFSYSGGDLVLEGYKKKTNAQKAEIFVQEIDVEKLLSGNYHVCIDIITPEREVICSRTKDFSILHPEQDLITQAYDDSYFETSFVQKLDDKELDYGLKAIMPQIPQNNIPILENVLKEGSDKSRRYFLYSYYSGLSQEHPELHYEQYMKIATAVDKTFSNNVGFGFETDRGFIFLKYGKPDDMIQVDQEPSAPPYEIWVYNEIPQTLQRNIKFLFYNPSLAGNDFQLLHSTCRGEVNNPNWETDLYGDALNEIPANRIDNKQVGDGYYRNARRYFTDF